MTTYGQERGKKQRKEMKLLCVKMNSSGFLTFKLLGFSDVQVDILCHTWMGLEQPQQQKTAK